jgi:hypothetical protein
MFFLLRAALVVGVIFYFSPARQSRDGTLSLETLIGAAAHPSETIAGKAPERLEAAWNALPESAKQVLLDKIKPASQRAGEAVRPPQTDTLLPEDHRPAWTGTVKKPGA